jgi:3-methylcrotonyl-CoA carboxylase alpha subunit
METLPFIVTDDAVYAAHFPEPKAKRHYTWHRLSATHNAAQVKIEGLSHTAHYIVSGNVVFLELDGFFYRLPYTNLCQTDETAVATQVVRAEIPGRIVKVLVKPGDSVVQNQPLLVQEAMKMEITLRAPASLVVANVQVAEGAQVEADAVLITFETPDEGSGS